MIDLKNTLKLSKATLIVLYSFMLSLIIFGMVVNHFKINFKKIKFKNYLWQNLNNI